MAKAENCIQCMYHISLSLPFLYHNINALFSVFQNKNYPQQTLVSKGGTQSNTNQSHSPPCCTSLGWRWCSFSHHTFTICPWTVLSSTWGQDTVALEGPSHSHPLWEVNFHLAHEHLIKMPLHGDKDYGYRSSFGLSCLLWWQHKPPNTSCLTLSCPFGKFWSWNSEFTPPTKLTHSNSGCCREFGSIPSPLLLLHQAEHTSGQLLLKFLPNMSLICVVHDRSPKLELTCHHLAYLSLNKQNNLLLSTY